MFFHMGGNLKFFEVPEPVWGEKFRISIQGESSEFFQVPEPIWGDKLKIFLNPKAYMGDDELGIFPSPTAYYFRHISSYFYIFLHIFHIFLQIYCIEEFRNVTSSGGGVVLVNLENTPGVQGCKMFVFKSPRHFPECDVIGGRGWGVFSRILKLPRQGIKHER